MIESANDPELLAIRNYAHSKLPLLLLQIDHPNIGFGRGKRVIKRVVVVGQPVFDDRQR